MIVQESVRAFCAEQGLPNPLLAAVVTSAATANQRSSRPRQRHPGGRIWVGKHQVRVNGFATDYLRKSRAEAARASKLLTAAVGFEVAVRPTLVFLTGSVIPNITISSSQRTC